MEFLDIEIGQEQVKVCRVCLITDVKMFDLQVYPLDTYFEAIIGIPVIDTMDLPPYLCYECAELVRKFFLFKDKCLRGQKVLYRLLQTVGKITEARIKRIDRDNVDLASSLTIQDTSLEETVYYEVKVADYEVKVADLQDIKEEPIMLNDNGTIEISEDFSCVKEEDIDFPLADFPYSSDDEPLSIHKTVKEKKKGKKSGRKKKKMKKHKLSLLAFKDESGEPCEGIEILLEGEPREGSSQNKDPKYPTRRTKYTGGINGGDIDLEEYVTIITLTLEEQMAEVTKRKESSNYLNAAYQCNLCYKGFIDTNAWKHHLEKHDPSVGEDQCSICHFRFSSRRALNKHLVNHEKRYACKACDNVSKTTTQAKQHQRWHKGVTYTCEYCDEVTTKWTSYLSHVRIKHPSQHICGVCGYSFVSRHGLTMHRTMMHKDADKLAENDEGPYCADCDVKFVSTEAYNRHMVTSVKHSESNNFSKGCRVCGATFSNPEELRVHHRKEHPRTKPKNYGKKKGSIEWPVKCEHCDEEIENARDHWNHFRRAHQDKVYPIKKDYVCDICGKSFQSNAFLKYHKRTHTEERAYKCATCGKAFHNKTNLYMHERTHSDLRPYACDVCCKAFKIQGALDRHYRSHTGDKPYSCEVCGKSFGQSNSCKLHVRTVHLRQPAPYLSRARAAADRARPHPRPRRLPADHAP